MEKDSRMMIADVDLGDADEIEIDIDLPQQHDPFSHDVMVDDVSVGSQHFEDEDMVDEDGQQLEEDIDDEPMEYYDDHSFDAAGQHASVEHDDIPEEEMSPVDDELQQPPYQETQPSFGQHRPSPHLSHDEAQMVFDQQQADPLVAADATQLHGSSATTMAQAQSQAPSAVAVDLTRLEPAPETAALSEQASVTPAIQDNDDREYGAPEDAAAGTVGESAQSPARSPSRPVAEATAPKPEQHRENGLTAAPVGEEAAQEIQAADGADQEKGYETSHVENEQPLEVKQVDESQQAVAVQEPSDRHHEYTVTDASLALHSIKILYQESDIYLFPPPESDASDTFFLKDESIAGQPMGDLIAACREVLEAHLAPHEELLLEIDRLGLSFGERPSEPYTMSLYQVVEVYLQLCANDHVNVPEPMYIALHTRPHANAEFAHLVEAAQNGQGLSYFLSYEEDEGEGKAEPATNAQVEEAGQAEEQGRQVEGGEQTSEQEKQLGQESGLVTQAQEEDNGVGKEGRHANDDESREHPENQEGREEEHRSDVDTAVEQIPQDAPAHKSPSPQETKNSNEKLVSQPSEADDLKASPPAVADEASALQEPQEYVAQVDSELGDAAPGDAEAGLEHEELDRQDSQELLSDLGDQTIAEYEGVDYVSQDSGHQTDAVAASQEEVSVHTSELPEGSAEVEEALDSHGDDTYEYSEHDDAAYLEGNEATGAADAEHEPSVTDLPSHGTGAAHGDAEVVTSEAQGRQPEEGTEDHQDEPQAVKYEGEDAQVEDYENETGETQPDHGLGNHHEGGDELNPDEQYIDLQDLEPGATEGREYAEHMADDGAPTHVESNEETPVLIDVSSTEAHYEDEDGSFDQDHVPLESYESYIDTDGYNDDEGDYDHIGEYDHDAAYEADAGELSVEAKPGQDEIASIKRLRESDEHDAAHSKRRRS